MFFLKKKNNAILSATFLDKGVVLDCVEGCRQILAKKKKKKSREEGSGQIGNLNLFYRWS